MEKNKLIIEFGKTIKKKRIDCDLTREELSRLSKVSLTHLKRIEQGETDARLGTIVKIGKALGENEFLVKF